MDISSTMATVNYRYPIRENNRFRLLVDGDECFRAMLAVIESASRSIFVEQYLVESGAVTSQFIEQLSLAAGRGVGVYMLLDDFGSSGLREADRKQLLSAGIRLCFFNPFRFRHIFNNLFRNHRKSMIVDGELAFVGGTGLADEFSRQQYGSKAWKDVMLEIRGSVVSDWCHLFRETWNDSTREESRQETSQEARQETRQKIRLPGLPPSTGVGTTSGRVLVSSPFHRLEISRGLIGQIRKARKRVWITTPYFLPSRKIRRILGQAAHRGVDVRLLLPGPFSDHLWVSFASRRNYSRLLREGVRIFEYQPRFTHAKIELCDDWVSIGSSNLDRWNQSWNLDANQTIHARECAEEVASLFSKDFDESHEFSRESWHDRPIWTRLGEALSGRIVTRLQHLIKRRRK